MLSLNDKQCTCTCTCFHVDMPVMAKVLFSYEAMAIDELTINESDVVDIVYDDGR